MRNIDKVQAYINVLNDRVDRNDRSIIDMLKRHQKDYDELRERMMKLTLRHNEQVGNLLERIEDLEERLDKLSLPPGTS